MYAGGDLCNTFFLLRAFWKLALDCVLRSSTVADAAPVSLQWGRESGREGRWGESEGEKREGGREIVERGGWRRREEGGK